MLPMAVVSCISVVAVTLSYFYLDETLGTLKGTSEGTSKHQTDNKVAATSTSAAASTTTLISKSGVGTNKFEKHKLSDVVDVVVVEQSDQHGDRYSDYNKLERADIETQVKDGAASVNSRSGSAAVLDEKNTDEGWYTPSNLSVATYAVLSFQAIGFDDVYNVWCGT